jgi:hypothetical protein
MIPLDIKKKKKKTVLTLQFASGMRALYSERV